jgi:hypothetical protein
MKTLADILLAQPMPMSESSPDVAGIRMGDILYHPVIKEAREALKMPARNHAAANAEELSFGACDRFILSPKFVDATLDNFDNLDRESRSLLIENARPPLPTCWIEYPSVGEDRSPDRGRSSALFFGKNDMMTYFVKLPPMHGAPTFLLPYAWVSLSTLRDEWLKNPESGCGNIIQFSKIAVEILEQKKTTADDIGFTLQNSVAYLAAITNPRAATVKRLVPSVQSAAERAFARRRFQQGRPIFSYNHVELVVPQTCIYRGEVVESRSLAGKRGHMVIGHWRLIAGKAEPFFTWIEGHERGNRELGRITKERHVDIGTGGLRRGFQMPEGPGRPGERRKVTQ